MNNFKLNWKPSPKDERDFKSLRFLASPVKLPAEFELDRKIPVYNQGGIGSCTSNSACSCFRYEVAQITNNFEFEPSRLFQYYNTRKLQGWENEDSGGYIRDAFKAMNKWGLCFELLWPYQDTLQALVKEPNKQAYENGSKNIAVKYARVDQNEIKIKQTLLSGAAVSFGFMVYSSFYGSWSETTGMMPIPKKSEQLLGGHACFTKDTRISLLDGREVTLEYLVDNYSDKEFYVYSYDLENNKIVAGKAHSPRKTGENQEILKITLDNGEEIKCTKNHPFLLKSGEYKNASELEIGQSLMPLYRKLDGRGYEMFLENGKWKYTHRYMVDWTKRDTNSKKTVVHHVDFNKRNNDPNNLELMTWDDHTKLHNSQTILLNEYAKSERGRQRSRELMSALWADPIWKENRLKQNSINGTKTCEKLKEEGRCGFQAWDKNEHSRISRENGLKNVHNMHTPEANTKRVETVQERLKNDPEFLEMKQEVGRKNFQTYNEQLKNGEIVLTEEQLDLKKKTAIQNLKNVTPEKRLLGQRKTTYTRFYKDKYETFEDFMNDRYPENHKVVNIEYCGVEDVYDITVEKYHNFALSSGVFVHNCTAIGFSDSKKAFLIQNSWGEEWGQNGLFWMPYSFALNPDEADDFWCIEEVKFDNGSVPTPPNPSNVDWKTAATTLFKTSKELYAVKKPTLLRLGEALGVQDLDPKKSFTYNFNLVKQFLGL